MKESVRRHGMLRWILWSAILMVAAFAAGIEVGHRRGYDLGWSECKSDAKEQMSSSENETFWRWYNSESVIRQHRSFWFF